MTGTSVDGVFTLTAPAGPPVSEGICSVPPLPPACARPDPADLPRRAVCGGGAGSGHRRRVRLGAVRVEVWLADQPARDYAQQRWGGLVVLDGVLQPVS